MMKNKPLHAIQNGGGTIAPAITSHYFKAGVRDFLFALAMMFIGDLVLATVTKQRLVFVNYLITIPLVFIFAFVIFGLITGLWSVGRILIIIGFVLDLGVIIQLAIRNKKLAYNPEEEK